MNPVEIESFELMAPHVVDPFWLAKVGRGSHAAVAEPGADHVVLLGVRLQFRPGSTVPPAGVDLRVWVGANRYFRCATVTSLDAAAAARKTAHTQAELERRNKLDQARAEAEAFNARLRLPVRWDVGIKDVLSGLSASSWGDGRGKKTVEHIYLKEPLREARLVRQAGDLLCTSAAGSNGKRWSVQISSSAFDGEGKPFRPKVTCVACLKLAGRWVGASRQQRPLGTAQIYVLRMVCPEWPTKQPDSRSERVLKTLEARSLAYESSGRWYISPKGRQALAAHDEAAPRA